jgi:sporulation protein YlmC with PRC-barrel domain
MVSKDDLLGKTVIGATGNYIGDVSDIDIDSDTWKVTHLHVKLSDQAAKEFGVKKSFKSSIVRMPTSYVENIGVLIKLNQSDIDLKKVLWYCNDL